MICAWFLLGFCLIFEKRVQNTFKHLLKIFQKSFKNCSNIIQNHSKIVQKSFKHRSKIIWTIFEWFFKKTLAFCWVVLLFLKKKTTEKNRSKLIQNWFKNHPKIMQKSFKTHSKIMLKIAIIQKSFKNQSKNIRKSFKNRWNSKTPKFNWNSIEIRLRFHRNSCGFRFEFLFLLILMFQNPNK